MEMAEFAGSVDDRDLLIGHGRRLRRARHRPRRLRRRLHRGRPPRAAPHDPRRRGRAGRQHRDRRARARVRADRPRLPPPRRRRADRRDRRAPDPARRLPDLERDDRQRRADGGRPPVRPPARGGRAGDAELRRPRDDALRRRRRVRGRGAGLRVLAGGHGGDQPGRHRRLLGARRREAGVAGPLHRRFRPAARGARPRADDEEGATHEHARVPEGAAEGEPARPPDGLGAGAHGGRPVHQARRAAARLRGARGPLRLPRHLQVPAHVRQHRARPCATARTSTASPTRR